MIALALTVSILNAAVTDQTLAQTVCRPGWSADYRRHHPVRLKVRKGFVRDHVVSIELGGNSSAQNVRYQPTAEAKSKDLIERRLHREVCSGRMRLGEAQKLILEWRP